MSVTVAVTVFDDVSTLYFVVNANARREDGLLLSLSVGECHLLDYYCGNNNLAMNKAIIARHASLVRILTNFIA